MAVNPFYSYIVGADRPVGKHLMRTLAAEHLVYKGVAMESRERFSLQATGQPFFILTPSVYQPGDFDEAMSWVDIAEEHDAPVVLLSSLAVFNYDPKVRYSEEDDDWADTAMAHQLRALEQRVAGCRRYIILRVGQQFSVQFGDFAHNLLTRIREEHLVSVNDDKLFSPTPDDDIAAVIVAMLKQADCTDELWGTYHFCGVDVVTPYSFAEALLAEASQYEDLSEARLEINPDGLAPALCAPNADLSNLFYTFGIKQKTWRHGLGRLVRRYYRAEES